MAFNNDNKDVLHQIRVKLYPNHLPNVEGEYIARTNNEASLSIEEVCAALKTRGGFTGNYNDLVDHVHQFFDEVAYQLCDGFAVNNGYYSIHPVIGGTFNTAHESYDRKKHPINFRFNIRPKLRALTEKIDITIEGPANTQGSITGFYDFDTDTTNDTATVGGLFSLFGDRIRVIGDDPSIGVYFVAEEDPMSEVKAKTVLSVNTVSKLTGIVPSLTPGSWKIAVRTQYSPGSFQLKEPKLIVSDFTISI